MPLNIALLDLVWAAVALCAAVYPIAQLRRLPDGGGPFRLLVLVFAAYPSLLMCYHLTPFDLGLVYAVTVFAAPLFFIVMSRYLDLGFARSVAFRTIILGIAAAFALAAVSNPWHGWFGYSQPHTPGQANHLLYIEPGPGMRAMYAYMLLLLALAVVLALNKLLRSRFDMTQLFIAVVLPMLAGVSLVSTDRWTFFEQLGVSGIMFITTACLITFNLTLFSRRFLDVRPVNRASLMDLMPDALAVVSATGAVVHCNATFAELWERSEAELIDRPVPSPLADHLRSGAGLLTLRGTECARHFDVQTTAVGGRDTRMVLLRDVTEQTEASERLARSRVQLRAANAELERLSTTDALTGLRNRRYFLEQLERELARVQRGGPSFGLIALDIDHFKAVNDRFGHAGGDQALTHIARVMENQCRVTDTLARVGGEEFMVLAVATDADALLVAAERLRQVIARHPVSVEGERELEITASIGAVLGGPGVHPEQLMQCADAALYEAKAAGRNRVHIAPENWHETSPT